MRDESCVQFLQWALPRLHMRWQGFRRVRSQVCKRIGRRISALGLCGVEDYRAYLEDVPHEWGVLDGLCHITISRFYRDKGVFDALGRHVLPALAAVAVTHGHDRLQCWSAGCAAGEEAYSMVLLWHFLVRPPGQGIDVHVTATDADEQMLCRARRACYDPGSVKALPGQWLDQAFEMVDSEYCLLSRYRGYVSFYHQDIRCTAPQETFHLILCRNLAFTYFTHEVQCEVLWRIRDHLFAGGALVLGSHESLPAADAGFQPWLTGQLPVYRKI